MAIPCYAPHFKYLEPLLNSLERQTHLPDEVVISISQIEQLTPSDVERLECHPYPFRLCLLKHVGRRTAGANRSIAAQACSGDVISCMDADDCIHPQRLEALHRVFCSMPAANIVWTGHAYRPGYSVLCHPAIPWYQDEEYQHLRFPLQSMNVTPVGVPELRDWASGLHNGTPTLRRWIVSRIPLWGDHKYDEDIEFNTRVLQAFGGGYLIRLPLLHYYNLLGSHL